MAAGSSIPQCALIGLPGQIGHVSPAALSQTVKMKSKVGAPGCENSSQLFERRPVVSKPSSARRASRSEEHTSELQSLMRISYAVFCLKHKKRQCKQSTSH